MRDASQLLHQAFTYPSCAKQKVHSLITSYSSSIHLIFTMVLDGPLCPFFCPTSLYCSPAASLIIVGSSSQAQLEASGPGTSGRPRESKRPVQVSQAGIMIIAIKRKASGSACSGPSVSVPQTRPAQPIAREIQPEGHLVKY